ncbi:MFS transporter [Marinobacter sp. F3R08]|uniref:MFS transporter n=1 Tax=Marinobacter sp. F3R08 TaxID=2841559 RepID=UPI001C094EB3|nr:MFS transporter [Marinobacter sp. F3R08]MBU2954764.1 MFS transporter [Marinobacter sp. F3R08]
MSNAVVLDTPRQARINLVSVCVGLTSAFVVQTMLMIAIPLTAIERGASPGLIGVILSAPYLLPLLLAIPLGELITRHGGRRAIVIGSLGMMLGAWATLAWPGLSGLFGAQLLVGMAHMVMILAGQTIVAGLGEGKVLERYFGWYATCLSAGQLVGPLVAGWLLDHHGSQIVFLITGSIASIGVFSGLILTGSARTGAPLKGADRGYRVQLRLLRRNPGVQVSIALTVAVVFALGAYGTFLPVYLNHQSMSATSIGALLSLRALSAMMIRPFTSAVIQVMGGRVKSMFVSALLVAFALLVTGLVQGVFALGLLVVIVGIGSGISQPLSMVVLAESVSPGQRSGALGMRLMGNRALQFLAPLILGLLADFLPYSITFIIAGVLSLLLVGVMASRVPSYVNMRSQPLE